ncbi:M20 family metallopeptidase [Ignavigranum ruoffiae]|uniref:M20 metallopeptidase family protein n=1 Tax=Ignavigranum ruoffiae TaxID=89093 RepID=UPI003B00957A
MEQLNIGLEELDQLKQLRQTLRKHPELSEHEQETREILKDFIQTHCSNLEIVDQGRWFYVWKAGSPGKQTIAFRADHDAISNTQGQVFHGCGHDGHSTILAGLAWQLDSMDLSTNVMLIFQHAEENGVGAREIVPRMQEIGVDYVYGLHNFPGFAQNQIIGKSGTFMCASTGMEIRFQGQQTHAGQPEKGINPAFALAELCLKLKDLGKFPGFGPQKALGHTFDSLVMATIISLELGQKGMYGIAAGSGQLQLTLRASKYSDLKELTNLLEEEVNRLATEEHLSAAIRYLDQFPDTSNPVEEVERLERLAKANGLAYHQLEQAFRPSEDFGWYLMNFPGTFFGLGSGDEHPDLHDDRYEFPDEIIASGIRIFRALLMDHQG